MGQIRWIASAALATLLAWVLAPAPGKRASEGETFKQQSALAPEVSVASADSDRAFYVENNGAAFAKQCADRRSSPASALEQTLREYESSRHNIEFDIQRFLEYALARDEGLITMMRDQLLDEPAVQTDDFFDKSRQGTVISRMGIIDLLEAAARLRVTADSGLESENSLKELISRVIPKHISREQKKVLVAEKLEAMEALARVNPEEAVRSYCGSMSEQKRFFARSIRAALVDRGISREEVVSRFNALAQSIDDCS